MKPTLGRGFKTVNQAQERIEERREKAKSSLRNFFPPKSSDDEVVIRFLTEDPINYLAHTVPVAGTNRFDTVFCTGDDCAECARADRPRDEWAWLVWDTTEFEVKERDSSGKETGKTRKVNGSVKVLRRGITDASSLAKFSTKYGLMNRSWAISKSPSGKGWAFDRGDDDEVTEKEVAGYLETLPDSLKNLDPYEILERQILPPSMWEGTAETKKNVEAGLSVEEEPVAEEAPKKKLGLKRK